MANCGKAAASLTPFTAFACVLEDGHEGECTPGGNCVAHGLYVGEPNVPPQCPRWPLCARRRACNKCSGEMVLMDQRWGKELWKCKSCNAEMTEEDDDEQP